MVSWVGNFTKNSYKYSNTLVVLCFKKPCYILTENFSDRTITFQKLCLKSDTRGGNSCHRFTYTYTCAQGHVSVRGLGGVWLEKPYLTLRTSTLGPFFPGVSVNSHPSGRFLRSWRTSPPAPPGSGGRWGTGGNCTETGHRSM